LGGDAVGNRKDNDKPTLKPVEWDRDLYTIPNLRRNPAEENRIRESIKKEVDQQNPHNRNSKSAG
jgi:hypothetical protein